MKAHNGMRPQDLVILFKIMLLEGNHWQLRDLSRSLFMSVSEISESMNRSQIAGLLDSSKKKVRREALLEFVSYGLKYVFPQQPGSLATGLATAHSFGDYKSRFISEIDYVWPDHNGNTRGLSIAPLYPTVPRAVVSDKELYALLATVDMLRAGKAREVKFARQELNRMMGYESKGESGQDQSSQDSPPGSG